VRRELGGTALRGPSMRQRGHVDPAVVEAHALSCSWWCDNMAHGCLGPTTEVVHVNLKNVVMLGWAWWASSMGSTSSIDGLSSFFLFFIVD
jgi:hypothetical protein